MRRWVPSATRPRCAKPEWIYQDFVAALLAERHYQGYLGDELCHPIICCERNGGDGGTRGILKRAAPSPAAPV